MIPTLGRFVHYVLTEEDAKQINRRRTTGGAIAERISQGTWSIGAQAHIGNNVSEGQAVPMLIVRAWPQISGQCFLDGNDTYWVQNVKQDPAADPGTPGTWHWPPRIVETSQPPAAASDYDRAILGA